MKVLISGYYGYGNLGDEALLSGIVNILKSDKHTVTVLSAQAEETAAMHNIKAVHRYKAFLPAVLNCDVFISGGGGLLQDKSSLRSLQYYLWLIRLAKLFNKKTIIFGQSVGPLSHKGQQLTKPILQNTAIAVRDKTSQAVLQDLGINSTLIADAALLMPPPTNSSSPKGYTLLIPRHGYPDITRALLETAKALINEGKPVAISSVQPNEDAPQVQKIKQAVPEIEVLKARSPTDLLTIIQDAQYVISGRLHGLILAAVANVNYAGLIYDPKVKAFLAETGAMAFDLPINTEALIQTAQKQTPISSQKLANVKTRALAGADWLREALKAS